MKVFLSTRKAARSLHDIRCVRLRFVRTPWHDTQAAHAHVSRPHCHRLNVNRVRVLHVYTRGEARIRSSSSSPKTYRPKVRVRVRWFRRIATRVVSVFRDNHIRRAARVWTCVHMCGLVSKFEHTHTGTVFAVSFGSPSVRSLRSRSPYDSSRVRYFYWILVKQHVVV